jgi:hypothetical protein
MKTYVYAYIILGSFRVEGRAEKVQYDAPSGTIALKVDGRNYQTAVQNVVLEERTD